MEIKRNGKVEHSESTHDDQVFSLLMALYVWYEGTNLAERYGIKKTSIRTDDEVDEPIDYFDDETVEIVGSFNTKDEIDEEIELHLKEAIKAGGQTIEEFLNKQRIEEKEQYERLINTPLGEKAYRERYNIPKNEPLNKYIQGGDTYNMPENIFNSFYNPTDRFFNSELVDRPTPGAVPASQAYMLEDEDYKYTEHFNF